MKNISKLLGLSLAAVALLLSACAKKPIRPNVSNTAMGPGNAGMINPEDIAVPADQLPEGVETRSTGTMGNETQSVVEAVYFGLDRAAVAQAERPKIEAAVKWLQDNPTKNLVLIGHCDWRGTSEYNLGLGDRRSNAVKRYLESLGVSPSRVETLSKGSTDAKQGGSEGEWAKDRRVDFVELVK